MYKFLIVFLYLFNILIFSREFTKVNKKAIFKKADDIMLKISSYSKRKPNLTVKKALTSKKEVIKYLDSEMKEQYSKNQFLTEEQVFKLMGLIKKNVDYQKAIKDVLSKEVAGYYNPKNNTMYIADWLPMAQQEIVLAHELFHAVQKQNYPAMLNMMERDNSNPDSKLAISSILEGEATAIMLDYEAVIKRKSSMSFDKIPALEFIINMSMMITPSKSFNKYSKYPQIMMNMMAFPYIKGLIFLKYFKKHGGWKAINKIYNRLPISTEQILHIDKYLSNEKPKIIRIKNKENLLPDCKYIDSTILGESFFYNIFKNDLLNNTNITDADGWNGDKVLIYKCNNKYSAILISNWDTPKDAKEFFNAFNTFIKSSVRNDNKKYFNGIVKNKKVIVSLNLKKKLFKIIGTL